ncbi:hypothetical protein CPB84DRAFT_1764983 [Gymnopilus junonius]|uniref:Uncharacterized protein n=1 Tax=Gymnopilus junonius TaxID=109634 RepID=A0A9P5NX83_GYMJU|nr:hypothetical protein CPB84DRAFT_1764983 [Gymnopilus junonius]
MGSICLSSASILRCASLTQLENVLLIIPTAVEVIFSTSLIFMQWGQGRRHLFIVAEGWSFLALVLLEMFSEIIPAIQMNLLVFRAFDLGIGIASFLPIFFYTFFLFLFASRELADKLPKGLQIVARLALILFIPTIIIFNEVASFVGVTIRNIPTNRKGQLMTAVGFTSKQQETLWTFFTSLTLALFTVYQAIFFFFAFLRVIQVLLHQRRIEKEGSDKMHFMNGIGWMSGGAKLGALEMVVGFAGGGFGVSLTRRILRLLSRACFTVGIVKGTDMLEDFQAVQGEIIAATNRRKEFRQSRIRQFISNPRLSTFRQLSPTAAAFHATPRAPANVYVSEKYNSESLFLARKPQRQSPLTLQSGLPGMEQFVDIKEKNTKKRVTVQYNNGTPKLHMRFSMFDPPEPFPIGENPMPRAQSTWYDESSSRKSRFTVQSKYSQDERGDMSDLQLQPPRPKFLQSSRADSESSRDSLSSSPSVNGSFQIVVGRQRKLSPTAPHIYQTPTTATQAPPASAQLLGPSLSLVLAHNVAPETMAVMAFPEPIYYEKASEPEPEKPKQQIDSSRHKSMASAKSMPDSLQAVHDLASQFPGPPTSTFQEPLVFREHIQTPPIAQDDASSGNNSIQYSSPVRGGRVPVTPSGGRYRISGNPSRSRRRSSGMRKTIDPFDDDGSTEPIGQTPRHESMKQDAHENFTPVTGISEFPEFQAVPENAPGTGQFVDLGMALDTGKSRQFVPSQAAVVQRPSVAAQTPQSSRRLIYRYDKFSRIAEWVDSSAAVATPPMEALVEQPDRNSSLQNLRERGEGDIPSRLNAESERDRTRASSGKKPVRIKTFGRAPNRPTPTPVHVRHTRGSLHLRPIVIPPRTGNMPEAVQIEQVESGSLVLTSPAGARKGVLRDSGVLGIADDKARKRQKGGYF